MCDVSPFSFCYLVSLFTRVIIVQSDCLMMMYNLLEMSFSPVPARNADAERGVRMQSGRKRERERAGRMHAARDAER